MKTVTLKKYEIGSRKFVGLPVDNKLNWKEQVNVLINKLSSATHVTAIYSHKKTEKL